MQFRSVPLKVQSLLRFQNEFLNKTEFIFSGHPSRHVTCGIRLFEEQEEL